MLRSPQRRDSGMFFENDACTVPVACSPRRSGTLIPLIGVSEARAISRATHPRDPHYEFSWLARAASRSGPPRSDAPGMAPTKGSADPPDPSDPRVNVLVASRATTPPEWRGEFTDPSIA